MIANERLYIINENKTMFHSNILSFQDYDWTTGVDTCHLDHHVLAGRERAGASSQQ